MKIRCDVCDKEEASMFCCADEAALCDGCDQRVHHANKLASKHSRFSLLNPTSKQSPLCDICQERRAFLFCQEDRAILCRECDFPIHKASEHTLKHNRFLLTGVKLSATSSLYPAASSSSTTTTASEPVINNTNNSKTRTAPQSSTKRTKTVPHEVVRPPTIEKAAALQSAAHNKLLDDKYSVSDNGSYSTSSISEYLMETLPGWHVEDLLDPSSFASNGFCKTNEPPLPFVNDDDVERNTSSFIPENLAYWVQVPTQSPPQFTSNLYRSITEAAGVFDAAKKGSEKANLMMFNREWDTDNSLTVPQISPPSLKKPRHFH